jgi:hypothetical protein
MSCISALCRTISIWSGSESPSLRGEHDGVGRDAVRVARGVAVHLVDGLREPLDRLLERGLEVLVEPRVLDRRRGARADDAEQLALPLVEALAGVNEHAAMKPMSRVLHPERHGRERRGATSGWVGEEAQRRVAPARAGSPA